MRGDGPRGRRAAARRSGARCGVTVPEMDHQGRTVTAAVAGGPSVHRVEETVRHCQGHARPPGKADRCRYRSQADFWNPTGSADVSRFGVVEPVTAGVDDRPVQRPGRCLLHRGCAGGLSLLQEPARRAPSRRSSPVVRAVVGSRWPGPGPPTLCVAAVSTARVGSPPQRVAAALATSRSAPAGTHRTDDGAVQQVRQRDGRQQQVRRAVRRRCPPGRPHAGTCTATVS